MTSFLNIQALQNTATKVDPFPYFTLPQSVAPELVHNVIRDFPKIADGGSYNLDDVEIKGEFKRFLDALDTPEFRQILCDKFDVDVMTLPMMITLRGHSRKKDGRIHTDSKTKVLTILIYLNESWESETGKLRILRSGNNMDDFVEEVDPGPGAMVAFKVTDNCWHGYVPFEGQRQSIQINFLTSENAGRKHKFFHGLSAKLKRFRNNEM